MRSCLTRLAVTTIASVTLMVVAAAPAMACGGLVGENGSIRLGRTTTLAAYRVPIWLPSAHHGAHVRVWGQLRAADHSTTQVGLIQFRHHGSPTWRTVRTVRTKK